MQNSTLADMLRKGIGMPLDQPQEQQDMAMQQPMGLQGALMYGMQPQGFQMSPQQGDIFGQYNNPMMFLRRQ